ncbi:pyruvate phosphate dikinase, partial [bacterium]|nr:pyruvate phosphate dikinase [bacterium]
TVELLRDAVLNDLWFFVKNDDSRRALLVILQLFKMLLKRDLTSHLRERSMITLLEFMERLNNEKLLMNPKDTAEILDLCFDILNDECRKYPELMCRASWFLKKFSPELFDTNSRIEEWNVMLRDALEMNLIFWSKTMQYEQWIESLEMEIDSDLTALVMSLGKTYFKHVKSQLDNCENWEDFSKIQDFVGFSDHFREARDAISNSLKQAYYILYLLKQPGMMYVRDSLLWDLNRVIQKIGSELQEEKINGFIDRLFMFFNRLKTGHESTVLDCILTLGKAVYSRNSIACIDHFINKVVEFGFISPNCPITRRSWQIEVDPNHVKNIRNWLEIIECRPERSKKLIAALVINLKINGMFISDTDLFQRDVTRLLNSDIENAYQIVRELCRVFPVYFNEIGAEGLLREVTTSIDEYSGRQDKLIHFLRKQIHTESNNTHIYLVEQIAYFWYSGDKSKIVNLVPIDVATSMKNTGRWFDPIHNTLEKLCSHYNVSVKQSLLLNHEDVSTYLNELKIEEGELIDEFRVVRLIELYQLLRDKYTLDDHKIIDQLKRNSLTRQKAIRLEKLLEKGNPDAALQFVFSVLQQLRKKILNSEHSESDESIYQKRHIAVGIPSMYGYYREPKFEALGLSFRLEQLASSLMGQIIDRINRRYISAWTLRRIAQVLSLFQKGLYLTGIVHEGFNTNVRMLYSSLNTTAFSIHQYVNLFQFMMKNVRQIIESYFLRQYDRMLREIFLKQFRDLHHREPNHDEIRVLHGRVETFYREALTSAFLVSHLDNYIVNILETLNSMVDKLTPEIIDNVMTYDPDLMSSSIHQPNNDLDSQIFLGAKGYFLKRLYSYKFPVPAGFILTTEMFRRRLAISRYPEMSKEVFKLIKGRISELELFTGKKFGDPTNPLLLSVRSGAAISLPGAMNTFLNVGMNDNIVEILSHQTNYGWTSWDCYRRFLQSWGMAYGITRDEFDSVILHYKQRYDVIEKIKLTPDQMRTIALAYKDVLIEHGVKFEEDPFRQIMQAIMVVMDSWNTTRAQIFRERLQISSDWGTAVILQQMVLGNINDDSGTGVVFTHDPFVTEPGIFLSGDFTLCSQGEDVVAGLVHTLPVSERQRLKSPHGQDVSLEKDFSEIFGALEKYARELIYTHGFGHQEIEFTFESSCRDDLYILQTRDHTWHRQDEIPVFRENNLKDKVLGVGIGISRGAMNGVVVFDEQDLVEFKRELPQSNRILIRPDTVPDDIGMIFECDGLLTARGGATSHAAVTAVRLGKTCVVNCRVLTVLEKEKRCIINGVEFRSGDKIAIDGVSGHIYKDNFPIGMTAPLELP